MRSLITSRTARRFAGAAAISCLAAFAATPAGAQNASKARAPARAAAATELEELVVTAEHREENLQRVAIAITAVEGKALEAQGVTGFKELGMRVPSLRFGAGVTGGENVITMRGLGSQNTTPGGDSPVAYNIDGVYVQRTTSIDPEFYDISRVEVLRGPQGTLYGRNSVGGSINVITNKPTASFAAAADALLGNYNAQTYRGFVSGPILDSGGVKVLGRLTGVVADHNPYATNLSTQPGATHNQDSEHYRMVRGQLLFEFGPQASLLLAGSASDNKGTAATNTAWWETPARYTTPPLGIPGASPCDFSTAAKFNARRFCHDAPEQASNRTQLYSATFDWRLPFARLTTVTAYGKSDVSQISDGDGSDLPIARGTSWVLKQNQFSQEVRLASLDTDNALKWVAGAIYFYADNYEDFGYSDYGYNDPPATRAFDQFTFLSHGATKTKAWAPFAQIDYDLAKTSVGLPLTVTLGLRYSHDQKYGFNSLDYQLPLLCGGSCANPQGPFEKTWGQTTGKLGLSYQINENQLAYVSVSRGYLAGGNIIGLATIYNPESMVSYDAGWKSRFWDNRLQLNVAAYHEEIKALQVFIQSSTQSGINNVNGVTKVNGLEAELTMVPIENLRINAVLTLTDAKYGRYITTDTRFGGPGPGCNVTTLACNFQGHRLNQTPPYTFDFGAEYKFETSFGAIVPRIDSYFSGKVDFLPDNIATSEQKAYHTTNLRVTWTSLSRRYKVDAFVNNIENDDIISNDGLQSVSLGQQVLEPDNFVYNPPRTYGVRVAVNF